MIILSFSISTEYVQTDTIIPALHTDNNFESVPILGNFTVSKHLTEIDIKSVDYIEILETITIKNYQNDTSYLHIWLNQTYSSLNITDEDNVPLLYQRVNDTNLLNITLNTQLNSSKDITLKLDYESVTQLDYVPGDPTYYIFRFNQSFTYFTNDYILTVRLPIGSFLHTDSIPESSILTFSGKRLYIEWEFDDLQRSTYKSFAIFFDEPLFESKPIWGYIVGPLLGIVAGASIVYLLMKRGSSRLEEEIEKIYLTKNQQLLLKLIHEKQGKITQQEIIQFTNFSKSKVSRNLTPLEENGLIVKEKWGREYKVSMTKKGLKVAQKIVAEELQKSEVLNQPDISKEEDTIYR